LEQSPIASHLQFLVLARRNRHLGRILGRELPPHMSQFAMVRCNAQADVEKPTAWRSTVEVRKLPVRYEKGLLSCIIHISHRRGLS
jgi:hypothetical protein